MQEEDFFRKFADAIPAATIVAGADGAIVFANRAAEELFRFGKSELEGVPIHKLLPGGPPHFGWRKDGATFPAAVEVNAPAALPAMSVYTIQESGAPARGDRRYSWVLESSPLGMAEIRYGGQALKVNAAFLSLFGMTRAQFESEGLNLIEATPAEWRESTQENVDRCFRTRCPLMFEKEYVKRDGSRIPVVICLSWNEGESDHALAIAVDLSAQKRIESELRTSGKWMRTLAQSLPGMVFSANAAGSHTFANDPFRLYTGMTAEALLGNGWLDALHPDDRDTAARAWTANVQSGHRFEAEFRLRRSDGVDRWHLCRAVPLDDRDGQIAAWVGNCTDIEDYKRFQADSRGNQQWLEQVVRERTAQLRDSEDRYRTLVEGLKEYAILIIDLQGCVASWNSCAQRTKGYTAEEILGRNFSCFYSDEDIARGHPEEMLRLAARNGYFEEEGWRTRKDGSRFWANVILTAVRSETGELRGYFKVTRDITERALAQERLRLSEQKFRELLESAPDAVVVAAEDGRITVVNAQAERLFGYERAELIGKPVQTLIPQRSPAPHSGASMILRGLHKDGSGFPVEVSLSPIRTPEGLWMAAAIRDVTERMLVEQQLVAERQRAEEANRSKSHFLAAMSHEIRTPMNAILGMSELLWESELDPEQRQYVEVFRRAGSSLLILIDDILDLSKIEAGHFELDRVPFNLEDVVDQAAELMSQRARKKGLQLLTRIAPEIRAGLIGDPLRLRQVLLNLLGNAVKFTESGEVLLVVRPTVPSETGDLCFSVSDTGIGIPPDKLEMIFEDFTQADSSTTRKYGGTGLGLAISRRIVELMGGRLKATSVLGGGSAFSFTAHFEAGSTSERVKHEEVADFHGRRVLVVDDSATSRLILHETLRAWGLESHEFANAAEGLAHICCNRASYALVILDRDLPGMDGFEAAARFQQIVPSVPIVMLTAEAARGDATRWRLGGLAGYAFKPVNRAELFRVVCAAMRGPDPPGSESTAEKSSAGQKSLQILIAEDAPDNRLLVQAYLRAIPHRLTFVEDGRSAVGQFAQGAFDLILMDIQMPLMDGLAATREIRALERSLDRAPVPIVALTAHAGSRNIEQSREAGCDAHLSKPISKDKLLGAIARFASGAGQRPPIEIHPPEGLEDLAAGYLERQREEVAQCRLLLDAADFERIKYLSHNMKGTGSSFGFPDLTRIGAGMEKAAKASDRGALEKYLAELGDYFGRIRIVGPEAESLRAQGIHQ